MQIEATVRMGGKECMDGFLEEVTSTVRISRAGMGVQAGRKDPVLPQGLQTDCRRSQLYCHRSSCLT